MAKSYGKNKWALFLLILAGFVVGSFLGHITKDISFLSWLGYGFESQIGDTTKHNIITLDLIALKIQFGLSLKITIASVICALASIFLYKKI